MSPARCAWLAGFCWPWLLPSDRFGTGLTLDEGSDVQVLDAKTWHERRERLEKLGGPPVSD
jgi:hypothetical protein